jgi:ubiquinone/menaquinone biosynthesis C-methylase UbiE
MELRGVNARVDPTAANLEIYRDPEVVSHYASLSYLTPCERFLFETYLRPGMAILDMGVGGGRTTPFLSSVASRYVGVDYSDEMIRLCQEKFGDTEFLVADASDLSPFSGGSFDAVVFSFNGLDYVLPAEKRRQCLRECARVLKANGVLIFSSHNPCSVVVRPNWNQQRLRDFAQRLDPRGGLLFTAVLGALTAVKYVHSFLRALAGSMVRIFQRVPSTTFWRGEGCLIDPAHGGLMTHYWAPARALAETSRFGFRFATLMGDDHPRTNNRFVTDWYYYVFIKQENVAGETCA